MGNDVPPSDEQILAVVGAQAEGIDPSALIEALLADHAMANVIEALQRALERGKIALDTRGMVVQAAALAEAA